MTAPDRMKLRMSIGQLEGIADYMIGMLGDNIPDADALTWFRDRPGMSKKNRALWYSMFVKCVNRHDRQRLKVLTPDEIHEAYDELKREKEKV